jgi:hypothetical protein
MPLDTNMTYLLAGWLHEYNLQFDSILSMWHELVQRLLGSNGTYYQVVPAPLITRGVK